MSPRLPWPRGGVRTRLPVVFRRADVEDFQPTEISGLALWLDASATGDLFQNSDGTVPAVNSGDPVGYWRDRSGNGRHATQSVSASRPTVGSSSTAGKSAVRNNGTGSVALQVAAWPYVAGHTQVAVFNASAINQAIAQRGTLNDEPRFAIQTSASGAAIYATRGGQVMAQTSSTVGYQTSQWAIGGALFNTALARAYRDGVYGADVTDSQTFSGNQELRLLSLPSNIWGLNGGIAEFLHYDRQLTALEVSRLAAYLSRKWGITLAPQVANADAQDWINRVYANGSTVSATTAAAVNTFCESIASVSGLREKFYRLNLFCGGTSGTTAGLNAALVPLYRGPSVSTTYGSTTDANAGGAAAFIGSDYSETLGLLGTASASKWLNTGFDANAAGLTASSIHMSCVTPTYTHPVNANWLPLSILNSSVTERYWLNFNSFASNTSVDSFLGLSGVYSVSYQVATTNGATIPGGLWSANRTSATDLRLYRDASQQGATNSADVSGSVVPTNAMSVFARWNGTSTFGHFGNGTFGRLMGYSVGLGLSGPQLAAYSAAMTAFNTAMGRNV